LYWGRNNTDDREKQTVNAVRMATWWKERKVENYMFFMQNTTSITGLFVFKIWVQYTSEFEVPVF
jgi:hypothetical protein